jgi:hypothetical protein
MSNAFRCLTIVFTSAFFCVILLGGAEPVERNSNPDRWKPLRFFIGTWEGEVTGQPGNGKAQREYSFVLNDRFIHIVNRSSYPPQDKNPKGETHEDVGFFSYDKAAKKFVLRQFHIEGFVNQFDSETIA